MHSEDYIREKTGLLLVDPYNERSIREAYTWWHHDRSCYLLS
jgi:hypothetical protein